MKNTTIKILLLLSIGILSVASTIQHSSAEDKPRTNIVYVTEKVPGADCEPQTKKGEGGKDEATGLYRCEIGSGFSSVMSVMGKMLKYFTFIAGLLAVLMLVIGGIMYSMGGADEGLKTKSKEYIIKSLLGLIVLLLSGVILYAVAPWVYQ